MATRRTKDGFQFDHGAQYFTARDGRFKRYVKSWIDDGIVRPWRGTIVVLENGHITGREKWNGSVCWRSSDECNLQTSCERLGHPVPDLHFSASARG